MLRQRTWVVGLGLLAGSLVIPPGCLLNPQPEDPFLQDTGIATGGTGAVIGSGSAGAASGGTLVSGTGGAAADGSSLGGGGGSLPAVEAECVAAGTDALIDDGADCDAALATSEKRLGEWFAYDSGLALPGAQDPSATSAFALAEDPTQGCAVHVVGGGYPTDAATGLGYAGVGVLFLGGSGVQCAPGYDASAYAGLVFAARGPGSLRILVETSDTPPVDGRPSGYLAVITLNEAWSSFEVRWQDLTLSDSDTAPVTLDPTRIVSVRFEAVELAAYDYWLDDLAFLASGSGAGGAGGASPGASGSSGQAGALASP